jgi:hypothetical protein
VLRLLDFVVYGTRPGAGTVSVDADVSVVPLDSAREAPRP